MRDCGGLEYQWGIVCFYSRTQNPKESTRSGPIVTFLIAPRSLHQETSSLPLLVAWLEAFSRVVEVLASLALLLDCCWCRCHHCNAQVAGNSAPNNSLHKLLRYNHQRILCKRAQSSRPSPTCAGTWIAHNMAHEVCFDDLPCCSVLRPIASIQFFLQR